MSVVYLGTSDFAATVLERLAGSAHRPALVITRPDRPRGRGQRLASPPVAARARELGIAVEQPVSVNEPDVLALIASAGVGASASLGAGAGPARAGAGAGMRPGAGPDAGASTDAAAEAGHERARQTVVVCAFGALIKEPLLSAHELLNVHPSLLPRWRGAAPVERAIMAGDARTGVSIMRLTAGLDSGPVCMAGEEPIAAGDTYGSLAPRLAVLGGELLVRVLDLIAHGDAPAFVEQDEANATYAEKIGPDDRLLDPARKVAELERVVRALHPHVGARVRLADGTFLGVHAAALPERGAAAGDLAGVFTDDSTGANASAHNPAHGSTSAPAQDPRPVSPSPPPGSLAAHDGRLLYGAADGALALVTVQPPGRRAMDAAAYLRGHRLPVAR